MLRAAEVVAAVIVLVVVAYFLDFIPTLQISFVELIIIIMFECFG